MKNILVPTDFSPCSKDAASVAYLLAKRCNATLHLLTSLDLSPDWDILSSVYNMPDNATQERIRKAEVQINELKRWYNDIPVVTICTRLSLILCIEKYRREHGIDLIVMGSHGASGKSEFFIGSNTQKVVRAVHCPVLVIKKPVEDKLEWKKVVFASHFSEDEMPAFLKFKDFIKHFVPEVHLVAIHTSPLDVPYPVQMESMKSYVDACSPLECFAHVYQDVSIDEGVRSFANEINADLVAISNHERHPAKRLLLGSNVEMLVNHADLPVLSIDFE
jgi:nucleotide-binding universal stress UspA family protein